MTRVAISSLNYNIGGYFLVVEHGLVARAAEQNFGKLAVNEVAAVDEAIAVRGRVRRARRARDGDEQLQPGRGRAAAHAGRRRSRRRARQSMPTASR